MPAPRPAARILLIAGLWAAVLVMLVVSTPEAPARARPRPVPTWATINICDTPANPNVVGVRGRMAARSRRTEMYMRFRLRYYDSEQGRFRPIRDAITQLVYVGRGLRRGRQAGFTFDLDPQQATYLIRGRVEFFWYRRKPRRRGQRRGRRVLVKRSDQLTVGGKKRVRGGDPPGFSAGTCDLR